MHQLFVWGNCWCLLNEARVHDISVCVPPIGGRAPAMTPRWSRCAGFGRLELELSAVTLGVHAFTILPNPDVFRQGAGVQLHHGIWRRLSVTSR